jgi:lipopolysaccharide/colanic/teichoic acid biosynthesis glycosyltransferase
LSGLRLSRGGPDVEAEDVSRWGRVAVYAGVVLTIVGLSKAHAVVHEYSWSGSTRFAWSFGYVLLLCLAAYSVGLPEQQRTRFGALRAAVLATGVAALVMSGIQLFAGDALLPRFVVLGSAVVLVPWFVLCAALEQDAGGRAGERERVLVVATGDEVAALEADLTRAAERPAIVVGWLSPFEATRLATDPDAPPSQPVVEMAQDRNATVIVLSRVAQADDDIVLQASQLHEAGVRIRTLSLFYEQWLGKLPLAELERFSLLFDIGELHAAGYARLKRVLDVALALAGCVALALLTPLVLLGNALGNRGPLFYRQLRVGRAGTTFSILKFRTMRACTPAEADDWTAEHDVRVTHFGGLLRRTHLDELPQVWNILRGDLSVVGPRPEQPQVVAELNGKIPFYRLRHLVRPGLTGWAQVKYQYAGNEAETLEKLQYEFFYLRRQSLGLDLRIVGRTARSVVGREGR